MKEMLSRHNGRDVLVYLEDVLLYAGIFAELVDILRTVMELLKKAGLKCKF